MSDVRTNIVRTPSGRGKRSSVLKKSRFGTSAVGEAICGTIQRDGTSVGHVFVLCAEPGMAKTTAISYVLNSHDSRDNKVRYVDLSSSSSCNATSRIVKTCRDVMKFKKPENTVTVAFDGIPASDESELSKQTRAIRKAAQAGCNVIISILPEGEALLEDLSDAVCFTSRDFLVARYASKNTFGPEDQAIARYTHGIPRLVRAAQFASGATIFRLDTDGRYLSALSRTVEESLRTALIEEERALRLAMIEIGRGAISDLRLVLDEVDASILGALADDAPFFGIDLAAGTFCCAGLTSNDGMRGCMRALDRNGHGLEYVSDAVLLLLVSRGDYVRGGIVARVATAEARTNAVIKRSAEFLDAGCRGLVEECVASAIESGSAEDIVEPRLLLSCFVDGAHDYLELRRHLSMDSVGRSGVLFLHVREFLAGRDSTPELPQDSDRAGVQRALSVVLRSAEMLAELRFSDCFAYLLGSPERLGESSVSTSLLWIEYQLACYLDGSTPTPEDSEGFRRAAYFAAGSGIPFLSLAFSAVAPAASILVGHSSHEPIIETCIQRTAYMGNDLLQAACLVTAAIADTRSGSGARAYVRLQRAEQLARASGADYLACACRILCCATRSALGERVDASDLLAHPMPDRVGMVGRALAAVVDRGDSARLGLMGEQREDACPEGLIWLVSTLSNDFGALSSRFRNVVPRSWVHQAERVADSVGGVLSRGSSSLPDPQEMGDPMNDYEVELSLLGGFHVAVNGVPVPEAHFERRRAKSLLALLGAVSGHCARRYEVMETVWPEFDFHDAKQRVYEATSVLRGELTTKLGKTDVDPLVSNRGASTIAFDMECVRCDVDEFERMAKEALSLPKDHAQDALALCAQIEELYHGDLFVPAVDGAGIIERRRRELRELHDDVMVLASTRALAVGRSSLAVHYAKLACASNPLREDAEIAMVRALGTCGRRMDAERSYQEFAERIVGSMRRPPSKELRAAYREVMDGAEGKSPRIEDVTIDGGEGGPDAEPTQLA